MRTLPFLALLLWLQQDPDTGLENDYHHLQGRLHQEGITGTERKKLLREFLDRHGDHAADTRVLTARCQLGSLLLERLQADAARTEFAGVRELVPADEQDLHGRALYGIAQAQELENDLDGARATLQQILILHEGTRYARFARVALARLERKGDLVPGVPLPALHFGKCVDGTTLRAADLRGAPLLLVFFAPEHDASRRRLEALAQVWHTSGQPWGRLVAFAMSPDTRGLRSEVDRNGWAFPVLQATDGFLHPDLLTLGVTGVPSSFLVGADGRLVARDLPPDRLAALLARARGG